MSQNLHHDVLLLLTTLNQFRLVAKFYAKHQYSQPGSNGGEAVVGTSYRQTRMHRCQDEPYIVFLNCPSALLLQWQQPHNFCKHLTVFITCFLSLNYFVTQNQIQVKKERSLFPIHVVRKRISNSNIIFPCTFRSWARLGNRTSSVFCCYPED